MLFVLLENFFVMSSSSFSIIDLALELIESSRSSSKFTAPTRTVPVVFCFLKGALPS